VKPCILIPSYNEERSIEPLVRLLKSMNHEVVVVDDGSWDNTKDVAQRSGARVLSHEKNMGKGASIRSGIEFLLKDTPCDTVIIMDADGQHSPKDIQKLTSFAEQFGSDLVVGNRMDRTKNMPLIRFLTNKLMSLLVSAICRQWIPDTQCGFRLIKREVLTRLKLTSNNYEIESEMIIKASRNKFKIDSIPVETIYKGELSRISPAKDTWRFLVFLFRTTLYKN